MVKSAAKIIVSGTVQGIFFRNFTKENSDKLNLKGHIRNLEGGDMEIFVEGEKDNINSLVKLIKKGPPYSQIRNVKIEEKKWSGDLKEFKVLRI